MKPNKVPSRKTFELLRLPALSALYGLEPAIFEDAAARNYGGRGTSILEVRG